jgi:hypothetical protein
MASTRECRKIINTRTLSPQFRPEDAVSGTGHGVEDDQEDDTLLKNGKAFLRGASFPDQAEPAGRGSLARTVSASPKSI